MLFYVCYLFRIRWLLQINFNFMSLFLKIQLPLPHLPDHLKLKRSCFKALCTLQQVTRVVIETWEMQVQKLCERGNFKQH